MRGFADSACPSSDSSVNTAAGWCFVSRKARTCGLSDSQMAVGVDGRGLKYHGSDQERCCKIDLVLCGKIAVGVTLPVVLVRRGHGGSHRPSVAFSVTERARERTRGSRTEQPGPQMR